MKRSLRTIAVLSEHYFMDVVKNPGLLACCLFPITFVLFFRFVTDGKPENGFLFASALLFINTIVPATATIYPMGEEKERHALRTLELAGVNRGQTLVARGFAAIALTAVAMAAGYFALDAPQRDFGAFMALGVVSALSLTLISLLLGLATRNQMESSLYSMPTLVIGIVPMFAGFGEAAAFSVPFFPTGAPFQLAWMLGEGTLFTPAAILPAVLTLAWVFALAVIFAIVAPRLICRENR